MMFRKEPFFYGHDNYDQLVKIAKVGIDALNCNDVQSIMAFAALVHAVECMHLSIVSRWRQSEPAFPHQGGSCCSFGMLLPFIQGSLTLHFHAESMFTEAACLVDMEYRLTQQWLSLH